MDVDRTAPVIATGETVVAASPETVWAAMTEISRWPEWNPDVKSAALDQPLAEGSTFRWRAGPGTIVSTIRALEPPLRIGWTGRTMGITAVHVWLLEPREGGTLVRTEESWDGLLPRLFRGPMRRALERAVGAGLGHLRVEAERRTGSA